MKVDYALILSAGVGSRMGVIGKELPKPLWPVFDKCLLDLQIAYLKQYGVSNIYINVYHQAHQIIEYLNAKHSDVKILIEEELLGIGGAIHNLSRQKEVNYSGNLFVINSDQFLMIPTEKIEQDIKKLNEAPVLLYAIEVENNDLYGSIQVDANHKLIKLIPNSELPRNQRSITYTGNSLVNLSKLTPCEGVSHFFDTIAEYKNKTIHADIIKNQEYWDFGTIKRYCDSLYKVLTLSSQNDFKKFLTTSGALNSTKINIEKMSYNSDEEYNLDFNQSNFVINKKKDVIRFQDLEMKASFQAS